MYSSTLNETLFYSLKITKKYVKITFFYHCLFIISSLKFIHVYGVITYFSFIIFFFKLAFYLLYSRSTHETTVLLKFYFFKLSFLKHEKKTLSKRTFFSLLLIFSGFILMNFHIYRILDDVYGVFRSPDTDFKNP